MSTFTWQPAPGASQPVKPSVRTSPFGDGYQQRVPDGINTIKRAWSLRFTRVTADIDAIENFLKARAGAEAFDWMPPAGAAGKWLCPEWARNAADRDAQEITATFTEIFGD
jgi:phage-related protein